MAVSEAVDPDEFGLFLQENGKINLNRTDSFTLFDQILAIKDKEVDKAYEQEKKQLEMKTKKEKMQIAERRKQIKKQKHHSIIPNDNQMVDKTLHMPNPENEVRAVLLKI